MPGCNHTIPLQHSEMLCHLIPQVFVFMRVEEEDVNAHVVVSRGYFLHAV